MEKASTTRPRVALPLKNATHLHGTVPGYFSAKKYLNPMLVYPIDNSRPSPTSGYRTVMSIERLRNRDFRESDFLTTLFQHFYPKGFSLLIVERAAFTSIILAGYIVPDLHVEGLSY